MLNKSMSGILNAIFFKIMISIMLLAFIAIQINWGDVGGSIEHISGWVLGGSFLCLVLQTLVLGGRWHLIVNTGRVRMSYRKSLEVTFAALIANLLFLTSISGLAVRIALTVRHKISLLFALGASLIDRLMTVLALLILAAIFMPFATEFMGQEIIIMGASLLGTIVALLLGLFALSKTKYGAFLQSSRKTAATIKYMQSIFVRPVLFSSIISVSLVAQLLYFGSVHILLNASGAEISFVQLLTVLPMIALISSLPIGIGGWGVREGAFVYGLGLLGVGIEQAFIVSIQVGLLGLISAVMVGLPTWFIQERKQDTKQVTRT